MICLLIFREREKKTGRGRERERERESATETENHQRERETSISYSPYIPWPGIKPTTNVYGLTMDQTFNSLVYGMMLQPSEPPGQCLIMVNFKSYVHQHEGIPMPRLNVAASFWYLEHFAQWKSCLAFRHFLVPVSHHQCAFNRLDRSFPKIQKGLRLVSVEWPISYSGCLV